MESRESAKLSGSNQSDSSLELTSTSLNVLKRLDLLPILLTPIREQPEEESKQASKKISSFVRVSEHPLSTPDSSISISQTPTDQFLRARSSSLTLLGEGKTMNMLAFDEELGEAPALYSRTPLSRSKESQGWLSWGYDIIVRRLLSLHTIMSTETVRGKLVNIVVMCLQTAGSLWTAYIAFDQMKGKWDANYADKYSNEASEIMHGLCYIASVLVFLGAQKGLGWGIHRYKIFERVIDSIYSAFEWIVPKVEKLWNALQALEKKLNKHEQVEEQQHQTLLKECQEIRKGLSAVTCILENNHLLEAQGHNSELEQSIRTLNTLNAVYLRRRKLTQQESAVMVDAVSMGRSLSFRN